MRTVVCLRLFITGIISHFALIIILDYTSHITNHVEFGQILTKALAIVIIFCTKTNNKKLINSKLFGPYGSTLYKIHTFNIH
jgi:hypothetical protein